MLINLQEWKWSLPYPLLSPATSVLYWLVFLNPRTILGSRNKNPTNPSTSSRALFFYIKLLSLKLSPSFFIAMASLSFTHFLPLSRFSFYLKFHSLVTEFFIFFLSTSIFGLVLAAESLISPLYFTLIDGFWLLVSGCVFWPSYVKIILQYASYRCFILISKMGKRRRKDVVALLLFHSQCKVAAFSFLFTKKRRFIKGFFKLLFCLLLSNFCLVGVF